MYHKPSKSWFHTIPVVVVVTILCTLVKFGV